MKLRTEVLFVSLLICFIQKSFAESNPFYSLVAPVEVRRGTPYRVYAVIHDAPSPVRINATLEAINGNSTLSASSFEDIKSGEGKFINIMVWDNWKDGTTFQLILNGSGGIEFERKQNVIAKTRIFSVFIQTDKGMYKPSDKVNFRVIGVDPLLKPHDQDPVDIFIMDSQSNRIKQWKNATFTNGVFVGEINLSDEPVLGIWTIKVAYSEGSTKLKTFEVRKYVLPKFEVKVKLPKYVRKNDTEFLVTVTAEYTHGNPVKGQLLLTVSPKSHSYCNSQRSLLFRSPINGKLVQKIHINDDLDISDQSTIISYDVTAKVIENLTAISQKGTHSVPVHKHDEQMEIAFSSPYITPGEPYRFWVSLLTLDNTPAVDTGSVIEVKYSSKSCIRCSFHDFVQTEEKKYPFPSNGVATIDIDFPANATQISLEVNYKDQTKYKNLMSPIQRTSISGQYIYVAVPGKNYKVGDQMDVIVNSSFALYNKVFLQVLAHGEVIHGAFVDGNKEKSLSIPVPLTDAMVPIIRIFVYTSYLGEILGDLVDVSVEGLFKTKVELDTSTNTTEPGKDVTISASTEPDALVALLAVDQSVLLLKSGNDISDQEVIGDIRNSYHTGSSYKSTQPLPSGFIPKFITNPDKPRYTQQLLEMAGVHVLTNGIVQQQQSPEYDGSINGPSHPWAMSFSTTRIPSPASMMDAEELSENLKVEDDEEEPQNSNQRRVRSLFPETWLWNMSTAGADGQAIFSTTAPDTITSWVINAFAIHPEKGLGFSKNPSKLTVVRPFFATVNLPYSVVRGETVSVPVIVFNHLPQNQQVVVTMENRNDEFDFVSFDNNGPITQKKRSSKNVEVKSGEGQTVYFFITPKVLGYINVHVRAGSQFAGDELVRQLLVKPEGIPHYFSRAVFVNLRNSTEPFSTTVNWEVPSSAVPQSERVEISTTGDTLGTVINNLDKLLRMPYGCGEQNLINFVPDVVITKYLTETDQLTPEIKKKAKDFMEKGYQRQLTYKHADGSYSAFGPSDKSGSTWLTAFVLRSFYDAQPFITIDPFVLNQATEWLIQRQAAHGAFVEIGNVIDTTLQGGSAKDKDVAITAYVLTSLLLTGTDQEHSKYGRNVTNAISYLKELLPEIQDPHTLAVINYAFHLTNDTELKDRSFDALLKKTTKQDGKLFWSNKKDDMKAIDSFSNEGNAASIETTAYALLTYVLRNEISEAVPIVRWLIGQQNEFGGFASTQDTVVGIQALGSFAAKTQIPSGASVKVEVTDQGGSKAIFDVNRDNSLVLQKEVLNRKTRSVKIDATGNGVAIVQVSWSYHEKSPKQGPAFTIVPTVVMKSYRYLNLNICTSYLGGNRSNMALMEIAYPTGFSADDSKLPEISDFSKVKRVEIKNGNSIVVVYFDFITARTVCIEANGIRGSKVAKLKPVPITIYDYYDPVKRGEVFYELPGHDSSSLCELCEDSDKECTSTCNQPIKDNS